MAALTYLEFPFSRERAKVPVGSNRCPAGTATSIPYGPPTPISMALKKLLGNPPELDSTNSSTTSPAATNTTTSLRPMIREHLMKYDTDYLVREGQRLGLTIGPVYTVAQAAHHPHLRARDAFVDIDHPVAGRFKYPRVLVQMTATPATSTARPLLGEHNVSILTASATPTKICKRLRTAGVI